MDAGSIPGSGRSAGGGHGNPLQYCCLENPIHGQGSLAGYEAIGSQRVRHDWSDLACMQRLSVNCILLIYPSSPFPFVNHKFIFYVCESVFVLLISWFYYFLDSAYKWCHILFFSVWLTSLSIIFFKIHGVFPIVFVCVCVYSLSLNPVRKTDPERERLKQSKAFLKHVYKSYLFPF